MKSVNSDSEMGTRRVGEIMIPLEDYPHLPVWASIRETVEIFHRTELEVRGRKSLPRIVLLFDLDGSVAGSVRRRDLMRGLEPKFLVSQPLEYRQKLFNVEADPNIAELLFDKVVKGILEQVDRPVTDIMRPIEKTIDYDDHIIKAIYEMVNNSLSILPVVRDDTVEGVIRTVDVFNELAELITK